MASMRYAAGPVAVGRLSGLAVQVVAAAVVVWIWSWMRGPGHPVPWPMLVIGVGTVVWFVVRAVRHPAEPTRAGVVGTRNGVTGDAVFRILFGTVFALFASSFLSVGVFGLFGLFGWTLRSPGPGGRRRSRPGRGHAGRAW